MADLALKAGHHASILLDLEYRLGLIEYFGSEPLITATYYRELESSARAGSAST